MGPLRFGHDEDKSESLRFDHVDVFRSAATASLILAMIRPSRRALNFDNDNVFNLDMAPSMIGDVFYSAVAISQMRR